MRRNGKNGQVALLLASLLTLVSISFAVFGFWRLGEDLGFAGDFVFPTGLLSHWQVWMAAAAATEYAGWGLTRYSKRVGRETDQANDEGTAAVQDAAAVQKVTARV
jgi:hypothetical protein